MPGNAPVAGKGLFQSLTGLASTLVAILHTRLELLSTDLEDAQAHVVALLVVTLAALFLIGVGVVLATILLVVVFWETDRVLVLVLLAGGYLVAGLAAGGFAMYKLRNKPKIFAASLAELRIDRQLDSRP